MRKNAIYTWDEGINSKVYEKFIKCNNHRTYKD